MGFVKPKDSRGWQFLRLESILKPELGKLFIKWGLKNHFQDQKGEIGNDMWLQGSHAQIILFRAHSRGAFFLLFISLVS